MDKNDDLDLFAGIAVFSLFILCSQILNIVLLAKSYRMINVAGKYLGVNDKKQFDQLCMMLFMTIFIAMSYFAWFIASTVTLFFVAKD